MQKQKDKIRIEHVPIELLKGVDYNPRFLSDKQEADLTKSIRKYGLIDPVIANKYKGREHFLIGGNQRVFIARKLGITKIPVVYLSLNEKKEKELNLRLNKNVGSWNFNLLQDMDIDLLLETGFDDSDLSTIWDGTLEAEDDFFNEEEGFKKAKETDIKPGDMFLLGKSVLLCGDSTDSQAVKKLMGGEKTNMCYSDPPFNINLDYNGGISGKQNYGGNVDDKKSDKEYKEFLRKTIVNSLSVCHQDAHIFNYCDQKYVGMLQDTYKELGINYKRTCLWVKNGFSVTPQVGFNKSYEPCVYGTIGKPYLSSTKNLSEILNKEIESGNRAIDDILDLIDIWLVKRLPGQEYEHPTQKPTTLHEKAIRRCTRVNDVVLDLFTGAGSTLLSCEMLKRRCFTMEINPVFCQLSINRFETYANTKAKKLN